MLNQLKISWKTFACLPLWGCLFTFYLFLNHANVKKTPLVNNANLILCFETTHLFLMTLFRLISSVIIAMIACHAAIGQSEHFYLRKGDKEFENRNYATAEDNYRKAIEKGNSQKGIYNLGNSIYKQQRYEEAVKHYERIIGDANKSALKAKAFHNLGNAHYLNQAYDKSVEAYKNALRLNPHDADTKSNLALAMEMLKQQQQQQNQQQQQQKNQKDKKDQDQKNQQQNQQQQQNSSNQQQKENPEKSQGLSKEEAEQLLEIMNQEEQKVQKKLKRSQAKPTKSGKDW